jgi:hypothetical protein
VFSDAVAEFQESGTNIEESKKSNRNNTDHSKDNSATDSSKPPGNSTDIIQSQSPEVHKSMIDLLRSDDITCSTEFFDEKLKDQLEVQKIGADDEVIERSMNIGKETGSNKREERSLDRNVVDVVSQLHGYANTQNDNITSGAQMEDAGALGVDLANSANSVEAGNEKVEEDENFHVLSLPDDIHVVDNAENILRGYKDHTRVNLQVPQILDLGKNIENNEDDSKDSGSNKNFTSSSTKQLGESTEICDSEIHVIEDDHNSGKHAPIEGEVAILEEHVYDDVEKAYFEAEADVPRITPISDEREADIPETKLTNNLVPNAVEDPADNFELDSVLDATVGSIELKGLSADKLEEPRVEEIMIKQADRPPFELGNEGSNESDAPANNLEHEGGNNNLMEKVNVEEELIEREDVLQIKLSNDAGLNGIETPTDKLENESDNDKSMVKDLTFEGDASLCLIELGNDKGSDICTETRTVSLPKEQQPPVVCDHLKQHGNDQMIPPGTDTDILPDNDMNLVVASLDTEVNQESTSSELFDLAENDGKIAEEKNNAESTTMISESANCLTESQTSSLLESQVEETETENARIGRVEETRGVNVSGKSVDEIRLAAESSHNGDREPSSKLFEDNLKIEPQNGSSALENKHHLGTFAVDVSVDSSSQTDSLEGNWGSVSVQSDTTAFKGVPEGLHSEKSDDLFETPAFMTSVDETQGSKNDQKSAEIQTLEKTASPLQAGRFPSLTTTTHVADDSQGRKKNEQIIAKVTNWSTTESGKQQQRMPLKSLLGEAKPKGNQTLLVKMDENDDDDDDAKVGSNPGPVVAVAESARSEAAKEWNSPARYPASVKSEKRKVKGRPYWAQFVCCANVK